MPSSSKRLPRGTAGLINNDIITRNYEEYLSYCTSVGTVPIGKDNLLAGHVRAVLSGALPVGCTAAVGGVDVAAGNIRAVLAVEVAAGAGSIRPSLERAGRNTGNVTTHATGEQFASRRRRRASRR